MQFKKILVTGAGGLMGAYVVAELCRKADVVGFDIVEPKDASNLASFRQGNIEDFDAVARAVEGCDAVIHIAARPNIWAGAGHEIIRTNVTGTWNVLEAAEQAGITRAVITSSDSTVGFTVLEGQMIPPEYLPIDSKHPLHPTDPYALSKVLCEKTAQAFVERGKLGVTVIRPVYVLYPEFECEVEARAKDPENYKGPAAGGRQPAGGGVMWHYVSPGDLARAFRLALETPEPQFGPFFICGPNILAPEPTIERLADKMGGRRIPVRDHKVYQANPHAPLYDLSEARDRLGFVAEHDMRARLVGST